MTALWGALPRANDVAAGAMPAAGRVTLARDE